MQHRSNHNRTMQLIQVLYPPCLAMLATESPDRDEQTLSGAIPNHHYSPLVRLDMHAAPYHGFSSASVHVKSSRALSLFYLPCMLAARGGGVWTMDMYLRRDGWRVHDS